MLTKITPNTLDRNKVDIWQALAGIWGRDGNNIFMGRMRMDWIYSGMEVKNESRNPALAVIVYHDDTWEILSVGAITSTTLSKEIKTGIVVSQQ